MQLDPDHCYEAIKAHDARFDGIFFVGVSTTGIYCRPICRVRIPGRNRCSYYANAASAEAHGYRPCLRCRPELAPGAAPVDAVRRVSDLAVARIEAGALRNGGLDDLAAEFGINARQLRRVVKREYGVTPVELAQTQRLLLAKQLLADTRLSMADIAFASGFSSVRRFNHLFRSRYGLNPSALRRRQETGSDDGIITLKLGYRPPLAWAKLLQFLIARGADRAEQISGDQYRRTLHIGACSGWITAVPDAQQHVLCVGVAPSLVPVLTQLRARLRQLFDLDSNPSVIAAHLARTGQLAASVHGCPGLRLPGTLNGFELAVRAIIGQQISVKAATTIFGRFVAFFGESISTPFTGLDRVAPRAPRIAEASMADIIACGLTHKRAETIRSLARAVASHGLDLEPTASSEDTMLALAEIPGIGPWTTQYIGMRALANPDAFPHRDLALLKALRTRHPQELESAAEQWRPWRAYAAMHLWHRLAAGG